MKKTFSYILALCLTTTVILGMPLSVSAEEGRYDASYEMVGFNQYIDLGIYDPGTYVISSSSLSDTSSNILDNLSFVCNIPILGRHIPGCQFVKCGEKFLAVMPDARFCVKLTDVETNTVVWEGELTSGTDDLYLGDDHTSYRVEMKPVVTAATYFVYLAKK